jgi:5-formyl-3-hydroxy-2-methylpyridine 4-carboxylic acid 5-dehydrogenase
MSKVAVIGLGTMGPGIAATLARAGMRVSTFDADSGKRARAAHGFTAAVTVLAALGVPDHSEGAIGVTDTLAQCVRDAELVVETVTEDLAVKIKVFREIEAFVARDCILASDTSGIPITRIQEGITVPERLVGMHWSNPPHVIPMIEVIPGKRTAPEVVQNTVAVITRTGHLPIIIRKDVPGFVENRVLYAVLRECIDLVEKGVITPQDLDACVSWGIGFKLAVVGPMALLDMAGLDIYQAVGGYLNRELSTRSDVAAYIGERTARGELGIKTGSGIFTYAPEDLAKLQSERARRLVAVRKALEA